MTINVLNYFGANHNVGDGPAYTNIPIITQRYERRKMFVPRNGLKPWHKYLKDGAIIFLWMYLFGMAALFITMWSVSVDEGRSSFIVTHLSMALLLVFLISLVGSLGSIISMICCKDRCGSCLPIFDQGSIRVHQGSTNYVSMDDDITESCDTDINQRNIQRSFSSIEEAPSFHVVAAAR